MKKILLAMAIMASTQLCHIPAANADSVGIAMKYNGMTERKHRKSLRSIIGVDPVNVRWCGAWLGHIMKKAGRRPPNGYMAADSWRNWGKKVSARRGAIAVFRHDHVGLVISVSKGCVKVISANDGNSVRARCRNPKTIADYRG